MQDVVLDACCLINLYAARTIFAPAAPAAKPARRRLILPSAKAKAKTPALDFRFHVPALVQDEAQYILQRDPEDESKLVKTAIELSPLFQAGVLHQCALEGEAEKKLFVEAAVKLDDGEAACFAIAMNRGWILATDERPTEKLAKQHGIAIVTTPELVKRWAEKSKARQEEVARVVADIQTYAHYFPRKSAPLHAWWTNLVKIATE